MSMTAIATVGIGLLLLTSKPAEWLPEIGDFISTPDPILVIVVGSPDLVSSVRSAISRDRISFDSDYAFALTDERIIASHAEAASEPINHLGWIERDIEMVSVVTDGGRRWEENRHKNPGDKAMTPEDKAKAEKIASLINKPTLNYVEATMMLQHLDSTGQF